MRVTEVLRRKGGSVRTIAPDRSVREVLGLLAEHRIAEVEDERDYLTTYIHGRAPRAQSTT